MTNFANVDHTADSIKLFFDDIDQIDKFEQFWIRKDLFGLTKIYHGENHHGKSMCTICPKNYFGTIIDIIPPLNDLVIYLEENKIEWQNARFGFNDKQRAGVLIIINNLATIVFVEENGDVERQYFTLGKSKKMV